MYYDLIVIGMGLSGLMAAKTAADAGQRVLIIGKGMGLLSLLSNTIDVLGNLPKMMKMKDGLSRWIEDHPEHPYSRAGLEQITEALSSFISLFPPPYSFQTIDDENCWIPTGAGTLRPTYLLPATMVAGASFKTGNTVIVGFEGFKDFFAHFVADRLNCRGVTLSLPEKLQGEINSTAIARLMEEESFRVAIGKEIRKHLEGESLVGLPAFLGLRDPLQVKKGMEETIGAEVFEIPILPPSVPGMRIFNRFKEWLIQKGATFVLGHPVSEVLLKENRCEGICVANPPIFNSYSANRYILATGRFVGGGLTADEEKIFEPLFNLPVLQPKTREDWFGKSFFNVSAHPVHQSGIFVDPSFRPTDERENLILENVWIAGSILAQHHSIDEKSREGIEIVTGYVAAKRALEK